MLRKVVTNMKIKKTINIKVKRNSKDLLYKSNCIQLKSYIFHPSFHTHDT